MIKDEKVQKKYYVTTFYKFFNWPKSHSIKEHITLLKAWCHNNDIKGLIIVSTEGFNGTVALEGSLSLFKDHLNKLSGEKITFKDSFTYAPSPFRRMKVKLRDEIVTIGKTKLSPKSKKPDSVKHMSPKQWHEFLTNNPDVQLIDIRNSFEVEMGTFTNAQNWNMNEFTQFPDLVKKSNLKKNKPVLVFCTGGIRCEKGSLEMAEQGYKQIYQLEGGILNYLAKYPNAHFTGECFIFDHRVAINQNLKPTSTHTLCIHCGQPCKKNEFNCIQCNLESYGVCKICWNKEKKYQTCSKNCAHHFKHGHKTKALHQDAKRIKYAN